MPIKRVTTRGPAVLAAALVTAFAAVPVATAALPSGNLIQNPGAEAGPGSSTGNDAEPIPSWQPASGFTVVQYGASSFPNTAESTRIGGGANFFAGGQNAAASSAGQQVDVSSAAAEIDAGGTGATLSGQLGGFASQGDSGPVNADFLDGTGAAIGRLSLPAVTSADRGGQTKFVLRTGTAVLPVGTRAIRVTMVANRVDGSYNDTYFDNMSLTLAPAAPPPPVEGVNTNVSAEKGTVLVKLPPGATAKGLFGAAVGFIPLSRVGRQVPLGSTLDTTRGQAKLTTASGKSGATQTGHFGKGVFIVQQARTNPLTTLTMTGGNLNGCSRLPHGGAPKRVGAAARGRSLFSNVKGRFRTRGRNSSATVRGTQYLVKDTCAGTVTQVNRGTVVVRDFTLRKNVTVKAHHKYLARAPKHG